MPGLRAIRRALESHDPELLPARDRGRAAVAVVLREREGVAELLFIERAEQAGDPWSGHMAFPGGRVEPHDPSAWQAAERETCEEVGIRLAGTERLGRLDDLEGRHAGRPISLVISAFVYHVEDPPAPWPNHEVRDVLWVPVEDLLDPARHVEWEPPHAAGSPLRYPGIVVGDPARQVVWGLTYRFLELFLSVAGHPLPNRWEALRSFGSGR